MAAAEARPPGLWRRFTAAYARVLEMLLAASVAIIIIPVTLQVVARFTPFIPHYIWTEEMARFLFVWCIMIGAMVGVRESTHFEVDVWPAMGRRATAVVQFLGRLGVLVMALVFVWAGVEFTRFAWHRTSELAEMPLWLIHVAWPVCGITWLVFLGEQLADNLCAILGKNRP